MTSGAKYGCRPAMVARWRGWGQNRPLRSSGYVGPQVSHGQAYYPFAGPDVHKGFIAVAHAEAHGSGPPMFAESITTEQVSGTRLAGSWSGLLIHPYESANCVPGTFP